MARLRPEPREERAMKVGRMSDVKPFQKCPGRISRPFNHVHPCERPAGHRGPCE